MVTVTTRTSERFATNMVVQKTNSERVEPSLTSVIGYICCWPVMVAYYFIPGGDTSTSCLPVSTLSMVTICLFFVSGFQLFMGYLANEMFQPLWNSLNEDRREKVVHQLCDIVIRTAQAGVFWWIIISQGQSLLKATVSLDMERCPKQTVAFILGVQHFYAMMVHELLTMKKIHKGLVAHHAVVIFSLATLTDPAFTDHITIDGYYFSPLVCIVVGGECMAVVSPAFIYYHLYPNSAFGQFACYAWISATKTVIITVCFLFMPYYLIWNNSERMSSLSFAVIFVIVSINVTSEFFVLMLNMRICKRKYVSWRNNFTESTNNIRETLISPPRFSKKHP